MRARLSRIRRWPLGFLLAILLLGGRPATAIEAVPLADCGVVELGADNLWVLLDPGGSMRADEVVSKGFAPADREQLNLGILKGKAWLYFRLQAASCPEAFYLQLGNPFVIHVEVFRRGADGGWELAWSAENSNERGDPQRRLRYKVLPLSTLPGEGDEYMLRVGGPGSVLLDPRIVPGRELPATLGGSTLLRGLLTGGIVSIAAYCIVLAVLTRIGSPIAFSLAAIGLAAFYGITSGALDDVLISMDWRMSEIFSIVMRFNAVAVLFASLFHWVFIRDLLSADRLRWRSAQSFGIAAALVLALLGILLLPLVAVAVLSMSAASTAVCGVSYEIGAAMRRNHPLARITMLAFLLLASSVFGFLAMYLGMLPFRPVMIHSIALAGWVEALLLSVAIGAHVRNLRGEQERLAVRTRELSALTERDALTELGNRRAYDRTVPLELEACRKNGLPVSLLVVDIDHFKRINDSHGHAFGDEVIRSLGKVIVASVRASDRAYRYGGEEFVVLLPGLTATGAVEVANRIMDQFAATRLTLPDGSHPRLSVSIGVAQQRPGGSPESLFRRADAAMYRAKKRGRARTEVDQSLRPA